MREIELISIKEILKAWYQVKIEYYLKLGLNDMASYCAKEMNKEFSDKEALERLLTLIVCEKQAIIDMIKIDYL